MRLGPRDGSPSATITPVLLAGVQGRGRRADPQHRQDGRSGARELDLTETAVREWVKRADLDAGRRSDGLTTAEREELRRLRRENRELREEREILRKAAVFFARETDHR
jgi:transposase